jgi:hypothetical protein
MAQNIERIDKRIAGINEDKRKKIEDMQRKMEPTFTPKTSKNTQE